MREYLQYSANLLAAQGWYPEKFYHGLVLGMLVGLRDTHDIYCDRESRYRRSDVALIPKTGSRDDVGVILEFRQMYAT